MTELKQLTEKQLTELYYEVINMREQVLSLVKKYEFDANSLVSRTFEHSIETEFGRKYLKRLAKEES